MTRISLSAEEVALLRAYCSTSPIALIRQKAWAILLRSRAIKITDIAFSVGCGYRTIERWIADFRLRRMGSIFSGLANNENASKLTRVQKEEIRKTLNKPPSTYGLPQEFWDVPTLKEYVQAEFGVVYESVQSYHFLLKFSRLSFKYPARFSVYRDEQLIAKRMAEIGKEVAVYLEDPNWEVFCSDETRLLLEAITRRAWLRKGAKTMVKIKRSRQFQNYLGLLNQKTYHCELYRISWGRQEAIIKALIKHLGKYPNKRICIIWDNARCHKGKIIRKELAKGGILERVHLVSLPPYAPDTNPIEHVWGYGKDKIANMQFETFDKTKDTFETAIRSREFHYHQI